ncbi:MAG TPA: general stress protein, partial [Pirellulales bacterium]
MDQNKPIRVGVFSTMAQADHAVRDLLAAGFTKDHITVICSDKFTEQHFHQYDHQQPAGSHTTSAATAGGAIGALLGGLTA